MSKKSPGKSSSDIKIRRAVKEKQTGKPGSFMSTGVKLPPRSPVERNEEWNRELGLSICPICRNTHFKKKWHPPGNMPNLFKRYKVQKIICPACKMIKNHAFEGELFIENFPKDQEKNLLSLIKAFGKRATEHDPQDRIIETKKEKGAYRVTTTENQLAVRLGKKIRDAFRTIRLNISHTPEPTEVSRVIVTFIPK